MFNWIKRFILEIKMQTELTNEVQRYIRMRGIPSTEIGQSQAWDQCVEIVRKKFNCPTFESEENHGFFSF